jgi:CheY-like chemotaxis protein
MPDVSGIDLTKIVRKRYSKRELPIIMITTQKDVKENRAAYSAGVNDIIHKPFTEKQIGKALAKFAT